MRTNALTKVLMVAVGLWALPALPGPDTYLVGNGQDGARNIGGGSGGTVINNYAQVLEPLAPGDTTLKTSLATITSQSGSNVPDFNGPGGGTDGDLVMIIQTTGLVPAAAVGSAAPISLEGSAVGRWELARITNVNRSVEDELTLTLDRPLKYSYAADVTQVVRVPEYTALTLTNNAVVRAGNWDPETYTGGVLAFLATGAVTLGTGSKLSAKGAGFHGGTYVADIAVDGNDQPIKGCPASGRPDSTRAFSGEGLNAAANSPRGVDNVANGGGGGVCLRAGGGGGGNAGAGGRGGSSDSASDEGRGAAAGQGGAALNASPLMQLLMGGGGGAGHGRSASPTPRGGHGGGIIFVRAQSLSGGMLDASGDAGVASNEDGAGGGGAGGTIHARFLHATPCGASNFLDVRGGAGGATTHGGEGLRGPGGGGGGGRVLFQSRNTATCAVNVASGVAGLAVAGNHHDAVPGNSSFPYAGTATLMGTEFVAPAQPTITVPAGSIVTNNPLPTLSGISTANSEVVIYALEGGVVSGVEYGRGVVGSNGSFSLTLSRPLQTGEITHLVAVTEAQGLQGAPSASRAFTVDTEAPDTYFAENGVPASPSRLSSVSFTFASNELTGITYQCQVVSGIGTTAPSTGWEPCDSPYTTTTTLTDGLTYTMWVRAHDAAGNRDPTPARYSWLVDWTRPETEFAANGTPGGASNVVNPVFRFTTEANATFECILVPPGATTAPLETDSRWAACTNPYVAPTRSDNTANTLWVRAVDAAGNVDDTPATYSWTVDLRDPDTEFTGTLPEPVNNLESVTFTFSSNESNVIFECSLNGAGFSPCTSGSSIATTELEASFTLLVRAKDPANNVDKTPARYDWRTDKVRPDTVLHTTMGSLSNALQAGFDFNSPDADVVGFECILASPSTAPMPDEEDARWAGCAASYLTPELTHNTTYRLWVRAVDAAGNVDGMPASHEWRVDLEPPDT
ncbi:adventurous gliding motility protein AgmC, partial [Myxococcus xanthus]|uniref:adventurous gliding motility protein AgmC n=2 Tax=Myxococcaceae TaxID=31 RepID=UPI0039EE2005